MFLGHSTGPNANLIGLFFSRGITYTGLPMAAILIIISALAAANIVPGMAIGITGTLLGSGILSCNLINGAVVGW